MSKIIGNPVGTTLPKSNWKQTDPSKGDYIKNKPEIVDATVGELLAIKTIDEDGHIVEFKSVAVSTDDTLDSAKAYTDAEITEWVGDKTVPAQVNAVLTTAKSYTDTEIANLLNNSTEAVDSIYELRDAMEDNADAISALETIAGNKANTSDLTSHTSNKNNPHGVSLSQLGVTATAVELNIMDGVTATTDELNYVDGVTSNIQTQLNAKVPTSRTVNGKALSGNITLSASDVGADASGSASTALTSAKSYTDSEIAEWVGDKDVATQINTAVSTKANTSDLTSHTGNTTVHITSAERTKWNAAKTHADSAHAPSNAQANVIESIKVNGTAQTITSKAVDITVPTDNKDLANGAGYLVASDIANKADKATTLAGYGITDAAAKSHNHDDKYYTESEINTKFSNMVGDTSVPTQVSTALASAKSYTDEQIDAIVGEGASTTLDTIGEISAAIEDNQDMLETLNSAIGNKANTSDLTSHTGNKSNPHGVTLSQLGVTATSSELNVLDGITATVTELNYTDGVTSNIQTQLNAKVPTSRTVNGKALTGNVTLTASDVGADASGSASSALASAKSYTDAEITEWVGDKTVASQISTAVSTKANTSDLTSHTGNTTAHITSTERTNWNAAKSHADSAHAPSNAEANQNAFSNIAVGSTTIAADSKTDTLTLAGSNVTITPDATNDKVTIGITKDNVTAALGYTPPTSDTTYSAAGSSLGLVKSGGDVTISSGVITVNDDSHNHVISNVDGLQTALDAKAKASDLSDLKTLVGDTAVATQISTAIASKSDTGHTHDDRYYTESEIDSKLSGKSDTSHTHSGYVNQNAFSNVKVGTNTIAADSTTDTLTLTAGSNITLTADTSGDGVTIAATDTVYTHPSSGVTAGTYKSVTVNAQGHVTGGSNPTTLAGYGITDAAAKNHTHDYADSSHTHDYAASSHSHDDRYYTETEVNTKFSDMVGDTDVPTQVSTALASAKSYADSAAATVKSDLLNGAGTAYDTLKELGDLIDDNTDAISALETVASGKADANHTHNYAGSSSAGGAATSANKVNKSLTVKLNSGTTEGTNMFTFDGSAAKSVNITPSGIGAAASSHGTHVSYSSTAPVMDGTASVGSASTVARSDHKHPTDTSRAAASDVTALQGLVGDTAVATQISDAVEGHTHTVSHTPAGSVSSSFSGTAASHDHGFTGSAVTSGAPSETTSVNSMTSAGSLPSHSYTAPSCSYTAPSLTASCANQCLTLTFNAGSHSFNAGSHSFSAGSLPTSSAVTVAASDHTHSVTASGTVGSKSITPAGSVTSTFTGTKADITTSGGQ